MTPMDDTPLTPAEHLSQTFHLPVEVVLDDRDRLDARAAEWRAAGSPAHGTAEHKAWTAELDTAEDTRPPDLRELVEHLKVKAAAQDAAAEEEETPLMAEPTRPAAGVTVTSSYPQAGVHDGQDEGEEEERERLPHIPPAPGEFEVLEQNGFGAIRASMLGIVNSLGALPPEALVAAVAYNDRARRRILARGNSDPRLREALKVVEVEARYLAFVARAHKDLRDLQARIEARAVVTG